MRRSIVVLAAGLLLAGCSTTVPGTPVADPSGLAASLDTGSFATAPRSAPAATAATGLEREGYRMLGTVPRLSDIDPVWKFHGKSQVGRLDSGAGSLKSLFGEQAGEVFAGVEVAAAAGANDAESVGGRVPTKDNGVSLVVLRMATPEEAAKAVADPRLLGADTTTTGTAIPEKKPVTVPGYPKAVAYTQTWEYAGTATVGFLAAGRYVLGMYEDGGVDAMKKFFDLQTKALEGFEPTPMADLPSLPTDRDGIVTLTLDSGGRGTWAEPYAAAFSQTMPTQDYRNFLDAGVDLVGYGTSTVYRARDERGAQLLGERFRAESRRAYADPKEFTVAGVPAAQCMTFRRSATSDDVTAYCTVTVGRYLAELIGRQQVQVQQGAAATYLILLKAR